METDASVPVAANDGDYAIVEIMGHRKLVGRISEVERYGVKFLRVEPMFKGSILGVETLVQPASIFCLTPVEHATAVRFAPIERYNLPDVIAAASAHMLALPEPEDDDGQENMPWEATDDDD